ncbi:MAG: hypothetical protein ACF8CQ_16995 [Rhodopirellula sp. JB044]|uniref:hypothetical protein n=1 Tax=Rhodopirellula sp. JB044 TaxID=3342844 RepID=UPI00370CE881
MTKPQFGAGDVWESRRLGIALNETAIDRNRAGFMNRAGSGGSMVRVAVEHCASIASPQTYQNNSRSVIRRGAQETSEANVRRLVS